MSQIEIFIYQIDDRCSYRRDEHYPNLIFLATLLRWSVTGHHVSCLTDPDGEVEPFPVKEEVVKQNNNALDSTAAFLADHIESRRVPIFSAHSRLLLGSVEKQSIIAKLRGLDGGQVGGLASDDGFNYYIGGYQLYPVVREATVPVEDHDAKGHVGHRLSWDAPREWRSGGATEELAVAKEPIHPRSETAYPNIIGAKAGGHSRSDPMSAEIGQAVRELGSRWTPYQVMQKLKGYTGKQGSCITDAGTNEVVWRNGSQEPGKLNMKALRKRLDRRTKKAANTPLIPR